ncbi:hypothetical protein G9A89_020884 [Geosiphon pyriformis]|nr:hypothetical protein G9A89_020884 [Geosiphon pyriformis]
MIIKKIFIVIWAQLNLLISFASLLALFLTLPSRLPEIPEREPARLTGYLPWHSHIKGFKNEVGDTIHLYVGSIIGITAHFAIYWAFFYKPPKNTISNFQSSIGSTPATMFNKLIAIYCLISFYAVLLSFFIDVSKLWSPFGTGHNSAEVMILILLADGGIIKSNTFWFITFAYSFTTATLSAILPWPKDGLFFKFQGLIFDWMLVFTFTRLLRKTYSKQKKMGKSRLPLNSDFKEEEVSKGVVHKTTTVPLTTITHPRQLWLLVIASIFHIGGNLLVTLFNTDGWAYYTLTLTYGITFSLYAFYIYLETHAHDETKEKIFFMPKTPTWQLTTLYIWSTFLSLLFIRIATYGFERIVIKDTILGSII